MSTSALADVIVDEFGLPEKPKQSPISRDTVRGWMQSDDLHALGALYAFVMKENYAARIQPRLTFSDYWQFVSRYFDRCFRDDPSGEWAHSRYEAGWDLASWLGKVWTDQTVPSEALTEIKTWLANLYKNADEPLRRCIVDATLEHLFENREIARFFADWKGDPVLGAAHAEATDWSAKGGTPDLSSKTGPSHT